MGYMVEITENKFDELVDNCEEMVRAGGKVMKCLDSLKRERMGTVCQCQTIVTSGTMKIGATKTAMESDATMVAVVVDVTNV